MLDLIFSNDLAVFLDIEVNNTSLSYNIIDITTAYIVEISESECYIAIEDFIRLSNMNIDDDEIEWNVINELIANTNWIDVFRDSNTDANMIIFSEKMRQLLG